MAGDTCRQSQGALGEKLAQSFPAGEANQWLLTNMQRTKQLGQLRRD